MTVTDPKADLRLYLQRARDEILWKLDGLDEYDVRRPLTPTGTNLLGLIKHLTMIEAGYFGDTFDRPFPTPLPWTEAEAEANVDMWASAEESREQIIGAYRDAWAHADETIESFSLDAVGRVPWWAPEKRETTLHRILVHVIAETDRHAGHADIVRELIDGTAGMRPGSDNLAPGDEAWWAQYRDRVESAAREAGGI
jgi:uncharacterized damage-inducible protein DinB